jgi:hypothetical protein
VLDARVDRLEAALVRLAEAQARTEQRLDQLAGRMDQLAEAQRQTDAKLRELAEAQQRTAEQLAVLAVRVDRFDAMRGYILETRYRDKAHAYFDDLLLRLRVVPGHELAALLDDAEERGLITRQQRRAVLAADVIDRGRQRDTGHEAFLVAEVSAVIDPRDVHRAAERARLLARIVGMPAVAAVGGEAIIPDAETEAQARGVHRVINGHTDQ